MIVLVFTHEVISTTLDLNICRMKPFKVAEHSFQVPMPNSPLLLNYL